MTDISKQGAPNRIYAQRGTYPYYDEEDWTVGEWYDGPSSGIEYIRADIHQAEIERLTAALETTRAVKVKQLVWEDYPLNGEPVISMAATDAGTYFILYDSDDFTGFYCEFITHVDAKWWGEVTPAGYLVCDHQHVDDVGPIKAAAQADHAARILAWIKKEGDA